MNKRKFHLLRVLLHVFVWVCIVVVFNSETLNIDWGPYSRQNNTLLIPLVFGTLVNAVLFYLNVYWLIPSYLHKKRNKSYLWKSIILLLGMTIVELLFDGWYLFRTEIADFLRSSVGQDEVMFVLGDILILTISTLLFNMFFLGMAFLYRLPYDWARNERQKQQLVQDKLSAELGFLKAQMNPHFLFNGINSIYHLIGTDNKGAKNILLKFSDLLRYQLYECNEEFIPLSKELNYIQNYLTIEEIRKGEDAVFTVSLPAVDNLKRSSGLKIAPLLLTPFLENAFKYLSLHSETEKNQITITLDIINGNVVFYVKNTIDPLPRKHKSMQASGIGLENVKRRLALLYPEKHQLDITQDNICFEVRLKINLS